MPNNKKKKGRNKSKRPTKKAAVADVDEDKDMGYDEFFNSTSELKEALKNGDISEVDRFIKLENKVKTFHIEVKASRESVLQELTSGGYHYDEYRKHILNGPPNTAKKDLLIYQASEASDWEKEFDAFYGYCKQIKTMKKERSSCCLAKVSHLSNLFTGPVCGSFEQLKKDFRLGCILTAAVIAFYVYLSLAISACTSVYSHLDGCAAFFAITEETPFALHKMFLTTACVLHMVVVIRVVRYMCSKLKMCLEACCKCFADAIGNCCGSVGDACKGCGNVICNGVTACCNCCSPKVDVDEDTAI